VVDSRTDSSVSKILDVLKEHPDGLSITDLAALLAMNRNSVSKYLAILQQQGSVDMRLVGVAKIYCPTRRLPVAAVRRFCSPNLIVVDHNLEILEVSGALAGLIGTTPEALSGQPVSVLFPGMSPSNDAISLLRRALWGEEGVLLRHPGRAARGSGVCWFSLIPTVLESGRPAISLVLEKYQGEDEPEEEPPLEALRQRALRKDQTEGIVRVSPDGHIRWANDAYCRVVGKSRDELVERLFQPLPVAGEGAAWKEFVRSLTRDNPTATIDCRMVMPDGGIHWYRWTGRALLGPEGKILEYQYLCFAIHEYKMLEESLCRQQRILEQQVNDRTAALRESEERFRAVFERSPIGMAFCTMDGTPIRVNHTFLALFGIQEFEEIEGQNVFANRNVPRDVLPNLQGGKAAGFTILYSREEHRHYGFGLGEEPETICLEGVASPVSFQKNGVPSGFVLQLCDATFQRRGGVVTSEAESRYRNLLDALAEGVIYLGADGRITDASPSAERILGCSLPEMQGRTCSELQWQVICEDGSRYPENLLPHMAVLATGIPERKTLGIFNPREGRHRWLDILVVPRFRPGEAKPFQVVAIFSDITGQREIEEARLETERRYRALTESLPDVVFLLAPDGHLLYVNSLGVRMLHRLPEEILGKSLPDLFPDGQGADYRRNVASVAASGTIKKNVSRLQLPDGEVWYDTLLIPVSAQDGTCRYVMGIARDVTASKRTEEVSRKNAERFRSIFEESPIGIAVCDRDWSLLHVNRACLGLFGITRPEEVLGTNLLQICQGIGNGDMQLSGDMVTPFECRIDFDQVRGQDLLPTTRAGSIHVEGVVSPLRSPDGGCPEEYLIQMHDITNRVLAEGALRESHDWLAGIARHLPDAMFAINRDEVVTIWNLAMEDLTGIPAVEMLGKENYEYALPFYGKRTPMIVNKVLKPGETLRNRYRSVTYAEENGSIVAEAVISPKKADSPRIWWIKAAPLYDNTGEVVGAIESIRDITEQRRGEEILKKEKTFASTFFETL